MSSNHDISLIETIEGRAQAICKCGARSTYTSDRGAIDEWIFHHEALVEQVKAHLGSRTPSLKSQRDWFMSQADNTENSTDDRDLWRQLADEVDRHLTSRTPVRQDETLFD